VETKKEKEFIECIYNDLLNIGDDEIEDLSIYGIDIRQEIKRLETVIKHYKR